MTKLRTVIAAATLALTLGNTAPALAVGTVTMANGGQYFTTYGPAAYWRYDYGKGWCGNKVFWCSPAHVQWTYVNRAYGNVNWATWKNPYPVYAPEYASAFIPARNATATVKYTLRYNYGSYWSRELDQMAYSDQWVKLNPNGGLAMLDSVMLGDQSWWGTSSDKVAFDEIKIEN